MNTPLVSILIPCYNVAAYLQDCIDTILNQTYSNLQIILIDDGSTDDTLGIIRKNADRDSRIEYYAQPNQGVAATRNNLLDKAQGEFLLFVDGDDWIDENTIEFLVTEALQNDADTVFCASVINDAPVSQEYTEEKVSKEEIIRRFLIHDKIRGSLWNKLLKTKVARQFRFDCNISYGEDALFCWEYLQDINKVVNTDRQLYHYRMNPESISHQKFGSKKLTGMKVWERIVGDVEEKYPEFSDIAKATHGKETYYLLMQAGAGGYKKDDKIKELQRILKSDFAVMKRTGKLKGRELFNAIICMHWYGYGVLYYKLHNLK